jgi:hypothetical protein
MANRRTEMRLKTEFPHTLPFYLIAIGFYLIILSPNLLSHGMFLDGLVYSTISKNLADGIGTFWNPHFTATYLSEFHDQPPLAFGIQSLFFTLFGGSRFIDKFYSFLTFIITGFIMLRIWKHLGYRNGWVLLFLWFSLPLVCWACTNNILENSLTVFTSLSVLFYLKSQKRFKCLFISLSGLMLSFGFLTKGFVAFFPWAFPFFLWLTLRRKSFFIMVLDSLTIFLVTIIPLIILVSLSHEAELSLHKYIDDQVISSIRDGVTVDSRFFIIKRLFTELIPVISMSLILIIWGGRRKFSLKSLFENYKLALAFALLGLTGVLPIMISLKQRGFYILATFPFFAIAAAIVLYPLVEFIINNINFQSKRFLYFRMAGYGIFIIGIMSSLFFADKYGRDKSKLKDTYAIISALPDGSTINIIPDLFQDWSLHGYYRRFGNISLDPDLENKREYLLLQNISFPDSTIIRDYRKVELPTEDYQLFKKE